jgi:hypothetical protein
MAKGLPTGLAQQTTPTVKNFLLIRGSLPAFRQRLRDRLRPRLWIDAWSCDHPARPDAARTGGECYLTAVNDASCHKEDAPLTGSPGFAYSDRIGRPMAGGAANRSSARDISRAKKTRLQMLDGPAQQVRSTACANPATVQRSAGPVSGRAGYKPGDYSGLKQ